jgi:outer membrane protein
MCPTYNYSGSLRFSVSLPIFDRMSREEAIIRADVAQSNAYATLRDSRLLAQQTLTQQLGALRTAEQRIAIQSASVSAAEEDLRVQQQRYALGASTLLDVLTSQTQLDQARSALISARFDYRIAKAQLEALIGRDL